MAKRHQPQMSLGPFPPPGNGNWARGASASRAFVVSAVGGSRVPLDVMGGV